MSDRKVNYGIETSSNGNGKGNSIATGEREDTTPVTVTKQRMHRLSAVIERLDKLLMGDKQANERTDF